MGKLKLFISYSHADEQYKKQLEAHLSSLKRNNEIETWNDRALIPGEEWDKEIRNEILQADIILLMISSNFIESDYCNDVEVVGAIERHKQNSAVVIPIIVRACDWQDTLFASLQSLPENAKPIKTWHDIDEAFLDIVKGIKKVIKNLDSRNPDLSLNSIKQLKEGARIFLSIPNGKEAKAKRRSFIYNTLGKNKYESWKYKIIPGIEETEELLKKSEAEQKTELLKYINQSLFSIHIASDENDLREGLGKFQFEITGERNLKSSYYKTIFWLFNSEVQTKLESKLLNEVISNPNLIGSDFDKLCQMIDTCNKEIQLDIENHERKLSPEKKVIVFYNLKKEGTENKDLDKLMSMIQKNKNISGEIYYSDEGREKETEKLRKYQGAIIFYGKNDPDWISFKQDNLLGYNSFEATAVYVGEPIEGKLTWVRYNEIFTIKGNNEFELGVNNFLQRLMNTNIRTSQYPN